MSTALVEEPTTCPDCGRWSFSVGRQPRWNDSWAWLPTTLFLLGFYTVPLPAIGTLLADVWAKWQVVAPAPVNPPAPHLSTVWAMAGPGGLEKVEGGAGRGELVLGVEQFTPVVGSPPLMAGEAGLTEAPCAPPQQNGTTPRRQRTVMPFLLDYTPREARERMARQRYQDPPLEIWAKNTRPYYGIRVRVPEMTTQGRRIAQRVLNCGFYDEVTKRQAERKRGELLAKVNNIALTAPADISLREFVEDVYVKKHFPTLTPGSRDKYAAHIKNHILPALGDLPLKEIGAGEAQDMFNAKLNLAWNTRMDIRNVLSSIFTKAFAWAWWEGRNPADGVDLGRKRRAREKRIPTDEELRLILANIPDSAGYPRDDMSLIIRTVAFCGLRPSEAFGLRKKCIDQPAPGWCQVQSRYRRGDDDVPKSESSCRILPLGDLILEYRSKCRDLAPEDYIFTGRDRKPFDDRGVQHYVIRPAAKAAGIYYPGFGLHRLRSRSITRLQQAGASSIEAQIHAGHSKIDVTQQYTLLTKDRHEELVRLMQRDFLDDKLGVVQ